MIVPLSLFHKMPERFACGNSFETGGPLVAEDQKARYVESIAELVNKRGDVIGWIYLASSDKAGKAEYVEGNDRMTPSEMKALHVRLLPTATTSISLLSAPLPSEVTARPCVDAQPRHD